MPASTAPRYEFVISRRADSDAYAVWRFDPSAPELLVPMPAPKRPPRFPRHHQIVQIGSYLLEWGPVMLKEYQACFPYRLFSFDPSSPDPLAGKPVQSGLWTKKKFWAYRPDFGNPQGAHEGFDSGEMLMLLPLGGFVLNVIPTEGRGTYQLWNFDPNPLGGSFNPTDPLPAPYTPQGGFDQIEFGHDLLPMGNYVLDVVRGESGSRFAVYSFDPQGQPPLALPAVQSGTWKDIDDGHVLTPIGDLILDWVPKDRSYRLWRFDPRHERAIGRRPIKTGRLPAGFDAKTSLLGIQPPIPVNPQFVNQPGTMDFMRDKIKHVVYLMLENRSFDHILGWLYKQGETIHTIGHHRPFDGASTAMFNVDPSRRNKKIHLQQYNKGRPDTEARSNDFLPQDPYHDKSDVMRQYFFGNRQGYQQRAKPDMGGFVWNNGVDQVMWTYTPAQLPVINGLARNFAVSDEWFCSMPGATDPNRAFAFTGSAMMKLNNWQNGNDYLYWPDYPHRQSIWKVLWSQGITDWKIYHATEWLNFVHTYHLFLQGQIPSVDAKVANYVQTVDQFKADAQAGKLPKFSFLEPIWIGIAGTTSYHPGQDPVVGEQALESIFEAVRSGPAWKETAFIITFDEHGGIFDHVPPPYAVNPWPNDVNDGFRYDMMGVRVPTIVVSPWVAKQTVFRSGQPTPYDATSILATLLHWCGVPKARWALGDRTHAAPTFETVFSLAAPREDVPMKLTMPFDRGAPLPGSPPPPVNDLQRLMVPGIVWGIVMGHESAAEATKIADQILAQATDALDLHRRLGALAKRYA